MAILSSGLYGLFRLDGAPIDSSEAAMLGLSPGESTGPGCAAAIDPYRPDAAHRIEDAGGLTLLLGDIEELPALAARLHLSPDAPVAVLARAALERFGSDLPVEMIGEWSLLQQDRDLRVTLMVSAARRDRLLYAVSGMRLAVAPDIARLARLPWVDAELDETGLIFGLGRGALRTRSGDRTMLAGVHYLEPGASVVIGRDGIRHGRSDPFTPPPAWRGSFDNAVAESEQLLRRILRDRLARTAHPAALLSGGLDSSLLSWLAAEERGHDRPLSVITSVAPPSSGLPDEQAFADIVAAQLGLAAEHVAPPPEFDLYRPPDVVLQGASRPPMSTRHCLTETFQVRARALGATLLIDGLFGEFTLTARAPEPLGLNRLRHIVQAFRARRVRVADPAASPTHVRLAPHRRDPLPESVKAALAAEAPAPERATGSLLGYLPGAHKLLYLSNEFHPGALRMDLPYRDLRLLRLFAGFPKSFLRQDGLDRAPARRMLAGHLPDSIRLRQSGMPASPDHYVRLQRQAPAARARITAFRRAEIHDWLDLDWLDEALGRIAAQGVADVNDANEVQLTAMAAEYLLWWRERR